MIPKLAAIILTRNEERHIRECIESVKWADEVLVFDSGSTDRTCEIAAEVGARIAHNEFKNYAQQRNDALICTDAEWVFFVDADERCTPELQQEILQILENPQHQGYHIPRHNYIFGNLTRYTGWYPDYQMRLLQRSKAHYDPAVQVHEVVILEAGEPGYLKNPLIHYNYHSIAQFHEKQQRYIDYDAKILYQKGVQPKIYTPYTQPIRHFKWRFFDLQGYKDGWHGLYLSLLMSWYEYQKYKLLKRLWEKSQ